MFSCRTLRRFEFGKLSPVAIVVIMTLQTTALSGQSRIKNGQALASRILSPFRNTCNGAEGYSETSLKKWLCRFFVPHHADAMEIKKQGNRITWLEG